MSATAAGAHKTKKAAARTRALTDLRRQEILAAAVKVFSRKGFEAARAEDIAHAAKIAKGTLYLYFRSKESLYSAAIGSAVKQLQALSAERIGVAQAFQEKLSAAIRIRLDFWTKQEALYRMLLTLGREPHHRRQTNDLLHSGQQHLLAIFAEGVNAGEIVEGSYGALAWAILDMIRGATERRMDRVSETAVEQDVADIVRFALAATGWDA